MKKLKFILIFLLTGFRAVELFGNPKEEGRYIILLKKNGYVTEFAYYLNHWVTHVHTWNYQQNPIIFWKPMPTNWFYKPKF